MEYSRFLKTYGPLVNFLLTREPTLLTKFGDPNFERYQHPHSASTVQSHGEYLRAWSQACVV